MLLLLKSHQLAYLLLELPDHALLSCYLVLLSFKYCWVWALVRGDWGLRKMLDFRHSWSVYRCTLILIRGKHRDRAQKRRNLGFTSINRTALWLIKSRWWVLIDLHLATSAFWVTLVFRLIDAQIVLNVWKVLLIVAIRIGNHASYRISPLRSLNWCILACFTLAAKHQYFWLCRGVFGRIYKARVFRCKRRSLSDMNAFGWILC